MLKRFLAATLVVAFGTASTGQTPGAAPRTPWGHPDLQGRWTNFTLTLVERPAEFGAKEYFTEAEAEEYLVTAHQRFLAAVNITEEAALSGEFEPGVWGEERSLVPTRRTSLIVGPTGRLPPLTPGGQHRAAQRKAPSANGPEERTLAERCLWFGVGGPPMLPSIVYNSHYQIVQTPSYLMILAELGNAVRIIPLDGRPHLPSQIRRWNGDSRGRFEGDTLIVETTNFNEKVQFRGRAKISG